MGRGDYEVIASDSAKAGGFGSVRSVIRKADKKKVAWKHIPFDRTKYRTKEDFKEKVEIEVSLLKRFDHPNIVRYYDTDWEEGEVDIYMEWCEGSNLDCYIAENYNKRDWPSEREAWSIIYQLSAALAYCHNGLIRTQVGSILREEKDRQENSWVPVLHRDIKPENVLVRYNSAGQAVVKLCDFGLSHAVQSPEDVKELAWGGTLPYLAPEITKDNPGGSKEADVFALGCTFYYLFKRRPPYNYQLTNAHSANMASLPNHVSQTIVDLISSCINYNPKDRPDAEKLFKLALQHVNQDDRPLASIQTYHTISDIGSQHRTLQNPDHSDKTLPFGSSLAPMPLGRDVIRARGGQSNSKLKSPSSPVSPRQSADTFYSLENTTTRTTQSRDIDLSSAISVPLANLDVSTGKPEKQNITMGNPTINSPPDSSWNSFGSTFVSRDIGIGNIEMEIEEGIGSLVVDHQNYPPLDMLTPVPHVRKDITKSVLARDAQFINSHYIYPDRKRKFFSSFRSTASAIEVAIKADLCEQFILRNSEAYIDEALNTVNVRDWFEKKKAQKKAVYLVVEYIMYENARVNQRATGHSLSDGFSGASLSRSVKISAATGVPVGGMSSTSTTSVVSSAEETHEKMYEKRGPHIQAASVREVRISKSGPTLGDPLTVFFWGPRSKPL